MVRLLGALSSVAPLEDPLQFYHGTGVLM